MSSSFLAQYLRDHPIFQNLTDEQVDEFTAQATVRTAQACEILFLHGEPSAGMWVIESGRVKIYRVNADGREHIFHMYGPGDSFNDITAVDGGPNPASAATLSDSVFWVLTAEIFTTALEHNHRLALSVLHSISGRVRTLVDQIEHLALLSVTARLARFLLTQSQNPALEGPGITRVAIAAHLATTPETISRALRGLEEAGAIRFDRQQIVILDKLLLADLGLE